METGKRRTRVGAVTDHQREKPQKERSSVAEDAPDESRAEVEVTVRGPAQAFTVWRGKVLDAAVTKGVVPNPKQWEVLSAVHERCMQEAVVESLTWAGRRRSRYSDWSTDFQARESRRCSSGSGRISSRCGTGPWTASSRFWRR